MAQGSPLESALPPVAPLRFTAWQLIGWEGDCGEVRKVGGRATYSDVMFQCDTLIRAAVSHFTGTVARFEPIAGGKMRVSSLGYRLGPAGDH